MLLAVLFLMAIMVLTALAVAPALIHQAKRDREQEMIHRGTEYARAIKKYYKKFGRYPANLEQLDNTNNIRFLRRRFKDPLSKDGQWRLLRYGDIQMLMGSVAGIPGVGGLPNQSQGLNAPGIGAAGSTFGAGSALGAQSSQQQQSQLFNQAAAGTQAALAGQSALGGSSGGVSTDTGSTSGQTQGQSGTTAGGQASGTGSTGQPGQTGSNNTIFGNTGVGGQSFGGGAIVGVASKSTDPTIRVFNKKKNYNDWQFFYSPMFDVQNVLLRGPYNGQTATRSQIGTPVNQMNQPQPGTGTGQSPQNNQLTNPQLTPGTQFPPDRSQSQNN